MEKTITYSLTEKELGEVKFSCRLICDRQQPNATIQEWLENWTTFSRMDMFWIELELDGEDLGAFSVDPSLEVENPELFSISQNHCKLHGKQLSKLQTLAREWFIQQPEYKQQQEWVKSLHNRVFAQFDGVFGFSVAANKVRNKFLARKIEVATKYAPQFAEILATLPKDNTWASSHPNSKELSKLVEQEGVYRSGSFGTSGLDHIFWVYKTYVANKKA